MNEKFYSLEPEKRERIINAALKEFARSGYEKASTNEIIKEAQISKGSLFNYFHSKKELYLFLLQYVIELIEKNFAEINVNERDFFKRIRDVGLIKFRIYSKYPQAFFFLKSVASEDAAEVKSETDRLGKNFIERSFEKMYQNIDLTKFRDDIDIQKAMNIINWTALSFAEQQRNRVHSFEDINTDLLREWDGYLDILKRCFYKQGEDENVY